MLLQDKIKQDLKVSMKEKDEARTSALRVILGELQRQGKKELADAEIIAVIRKLIKSEIETLTLTKAQTSPYLLILESYLAAAPSEADIRKWIAEHVDFTLFKNKMQAMKPIMAHFGSAADGTIIRKILEEK